jgi:tetratricopeptide (TPR) repeat protein
MPEQNSKTKIFSLINIYSLILKTTIYLIVFLLPIFFLPLTSNVLEFNKQALLITLVSISLFAWILRCLATGKIELSPSSLHIFVGALLVVWAASTVFSLYQYGSFWGWASGISDSLLSLISLVLLYVLISSSLKRREIIYVVLLLVLSGFISMVYAVLQLFGKFTLPFDFTQSASFNTIGSVNSLAVFTAVILPLIMFMLVATRKFMRLLFAAALFLAAAVIIIIDFFPAWIAVAVGSGLVLILALQKRRFFDSRWFVMPMFFLGVAILFILFDFNKIPGLAQRPVEVFLTQNAGFDIAMQTIKGRPVLGSGPSTFIFDFSKFKNPEINKTLLWNARMDNAGSKAINILATTGVLGVLSFAALLLAFVFLGTKFIAGRKSAVLRNYMEDGLSETFLWLLAGGIFTSFIVLAVSNFIYYTNLTLEFLFFVLIGSFVCLLYPVKKEIVLRSSSLSTLGLTFVITILFIFSLGMLILEGQRYTADISYAQGLSAWAKGDSDAAISNILKAVSINQEVDNYWRDISQIYLQKIEPELVRTDVSKDQLSQNVQKLVNSSVVAAKNTTNLNPNNVANWSVLGFVYQNLVGMIAGTDAMSIEAYDEAIKLEPFNPYFLTQQGIVYLNNYSVLTNSQKQNQNSQGGGQLAAEQEKILGDAKQKFDEAINIKSDYALARFQLSVVYSLQGKTDDAINELTEAKKAVPFDPSIDFQLGLIYYQSNQYDKAQTKFESAFSMNNNYANAIYFLGLTYDKLGNKNKAIEKIEAALELNPDNEQLKKILDNLKNGQDALAGLTNQNIPSAPIEGTPEEVKNLPQPPSIENEPTE